jgi:transcriptional regulator with XRE-family HTH domain
MGKTSITFPFSGGRLRLTREIAGLTQQSLADRCRQAGHPVSREQISKIEAGRHKPSPPLLRILAEVLAVEPGDLTEDAA